MRISALILFLMAFGAVGQPAGKGLATGPYLESLRSSAARRCADGTLLRSCFTVNKVTCEARVSSRLDSCIRDQRIRLMGQAKLTELAAKAVEREVATCVNGEYYSLSRSSFKSSPTCRTLIPRKAANEGGAPAVASARTYEDPLEDQRGMKDRYLLRLKADVRRAEDFKGGLRTRAACPGYRGRDHSGCFKEGLANFEITSSAQLQILLAAATYAGRAGAKSEIVDNMLSVLERADLARFHLSLMKARDEVDESALANLRREDAEFLKTSIRQAGEAIERELDGDAMPKLKRQPANAVDFRGRLEFQRNREWNY